MWILRYLFIVIILVIILGFALQNMQMVQVNIIKWQSGEIPLYWVVFAAFGLGALTFLPIAMFHSFKHRLEIKRKDSEIKRLKSSDAKPEVSTPHPVKSQAHTKEHAGIDEV